MASPGQVSEQARQAQDIRLLVDTIPTLAWSARPDGSAEFFNRRWLDYAGLTAEEASDWGWTVALHPEDRGRLIDYWRCVLASGEAGEIEARLRRCDGEYRLVLVPRRATCARQSRRHLQNGMARIRISRIAKRAEALLAAEKLDIGNDCRRSFASQKYWKKLCPRRFDANQARNHPCQQ